MCPIPNPQLLRHPDLSQHQLVFVYSGDLWLADRPDDGGRWQARRLAGGVGEESFPRFSRDGSRIVFSRSPEGQVEPFFRGADLFIVEARVGAQPRQLTYHPAPDRSLGWAYDENGEEWILFASPRTSPFGWLNQLFRIRPEGGVPIRIGVPRGEFASQSSDGRWLAFQTTTAAFMAWKGYRGGLSPQVLLFDRQRRTISRPFPSRVNDGQPMWHPQRPERLFFLSDRHARTYNLYAWQTDWQAPRRLTAFSSNPARFPAIGPGGIIFEQQGRLHSIPLEVLDDLAEEKHSPRPLRQRDCARFRLDIDLVGEGTQAAPGARILPVGELLRDSVLSPDGDQVVFTARGDLWRASLTAQPPSRLVAGSSFAVRYPAISPCGTYVAYWADREPLSGSGLAEYQLYIRRADEAGGALRLTDFAEGYRYKPSWSPEGDRLAFVGLDRTLRIVELGSAWRETFATIGNEKILALPDRRTEVRVRLASLRHSELERFSMSWSPDGRWLAYVRLLENLTERIEVLDTHHPSDPDGVAGCHAITSGSFADRSPVFVESGGDLLLYFLTRRSFSTVRDEMTSAPVAVEGGNLAWISFASGDLPRALSSGPFPESRIELLYSTGRDIRDLHAHPNPRRRSSLPALVWLEKGTGEGRPARLLGLQPGWAEPLSLLEDEMLDQLLGIGGGVALIETAEGIEWLVRGGRPVHLDLETLEAERDLREEWGQIFDDCWRFIRDLSFDQTPPRWFKQWARYRPLLDHVRTRTDLASLLNDLFGEVGASHVGASTNAGRDGGAPEGGAFGADLRWEAGRGVTIESIYRGGPWEARQRSPLAEAGLGAGDRILELNATPWGSGSDEPWASISKVQGRSVELTIKRDGAKSRRAEVEMVPWFHLSDRCESSLRYLAWVERRRCWIDQCSGGEIGYVHFARTYVGTESWLANALFHQFRPQWNKAALVIDLRFCPGGGFPVEIYEQLTRELAYRTRSRPVGESTARLPAFEPRPERVVLINGHTASAAETLAWLFRNGGRTRLVGTATFGAGLITYSPPHLADGGELTLPAAGLYSADGARLIEGTGIQSHVKLDEIPAGSSNVDSLTSGVPSRLNDPQLAKALEVVQDALAKARRQRRRDRRTGSRVRRV